MLKKLLALVSLCVVLPVNAAIVDNGSFLTDTDTGIDYLKFSETNNNSWVDVVVNDSLGFIANGWSVVSQSALFSFATANLVSPYNLLTNNGAITFAITNGDLGAGQPGLPTNVDIDYYSNHFSYAADFGNVAATLAQANVAVALSRASAVPVPAAAYLFMSALLGLASRKYLTRK